jgi:hypothetical protein
MYSVIGNIAESSDQQWIFCKEFIWEVNVKHCSTDESCQSIVYSDASDIRFDGYIVGTPINIVHGMWFGVERRNSSTWK